MQPGLDAPISVLSKGNNQKIALAQALLSPVELLLLDEPWNGLDPVAAEALRRELTEARRQGTAVVATAHRAGSVPCPDHELVLSGGHLAPVTSATATNETLQTVVVELLPPRHADPHQAPEWAGATDVGPAGGLWRASVHAVAVDQLLARAIHDGWSVHRVDPGPAHSAPSSRPQSNEAQSNEAQSNEAQSNEAQSSELE